MFSVFSIIINNEDKRLSPAKVNLFLQTAKRAGRKSAKIGAKGWGSAGARAAGAQKKRGNLTAAAPREQLILLNEKILT